MNLERLQNENKLSKHITSNQEINNLLKLVERDIKDAQIEALSSDRRFITAYNAALQLATCVLYVSGYRTKPSRGGHHWITFSVLPDIMNDSIKEYADYFEVCRVKRNISDYENVDEISQSESVELIMEVIKFKQIVLRWIEEYKPGYLLEEGASS
jgi:hypothetical protein